MNKFPTRINYLPTILLLAGAAVIIFAPEISFAGTGGTEFAGAETRINEIVSGTGGRVAAGASFAYALFRSVHNFNITHIAGAVGVGIMAAIGPSAVTAAITAIV